MGATAGLARARAPRHRALALGLLQPLRERRELPVQLRHLLGGGHRLGLRVVGGLACVVGLEPQRRRAALEQLQLQRLRIARRLRDRRCESVLAKLAERAARVVKLLVLALQLVDALTQLQLLLQQDAEVARVRRALRRCLAAQLEGETSECLLVLPPGLGRLAAATDAAAGGRGSQRRLWRPWWHRLDRSRRKRRARCSDLAGCCSGRWRLARWPLGRGARAAAAAAAALGRRARAAASAAGAGASGPCRQRHGRLDHAVYVQTQTVPQVFQPLSRAPCLTSQKTAFH